MGGTMRTVRAAGAGRQLAGNASAALKVDGITRRNPALYTVADFSARLQGDNAFINRVMQQPKIWLIGQEEPAPHEPSQPT